MIVFLAFVIAGILLIIFPELMISQTSGLLIKWVLFLGGLFGWGVLSLMKRKTRSKYKGETHQELLELFDDSGLILNKRLMIEGSNSSFTKLFGVSKLYKGSFYEIEPKRNLELFDFLKKKLNRSYQYKSLIREKYSGDNPKELFEVVISPIEDEKYYTLIIKGIAEDQKQVVMGKEFISNASHELRTPITIIKGFIETLRDLPEISEDMLEGICEKVLKSCHRMDKIVKNLLLLTDLDHLSKPQKKVFDLKVLIEHCQHNLLSLYPEVQFSIEQKSKQSEFIADPDLLELAIMNLLQNAVKYSESPAKIKVSFKINEGKLELNIADEGEGIPKEYQKHIFDRFATVDKVASRKLGGAGLGLSLVKTIVTKHGGTVHVEDNLPKGSILTIDIRV